jgi:hypothetical protein
MISKAITLKSPTCISTYYIGDGWNPMSIRPVAIPPTRLPHALVVEVGRDFFLMSPDRLYLTGPGPHQFEEFSADGLTSPLGMGCSVSWY